MIACIETMKLISYIADVYAVLSIPFIAYQYVQSRRQKHLYEQLQLKIFEEKGRDVYIKLTRKTNKKKEWDVGCGGEAVLRPAREFLLNSTQYLPLLNDEMKRKHESITKKVSNTDTWTNYQLLVREVLDYLYCISVYVSNETRAK